MIFCRSSTRFLGWMICTVNTMQIPRNPVTAAGEELDDLLM